MKEKYTKAKKARRASGFPKAGNSEQMSKRRMEKRLSLQPKAPYTKGLQVVRFQRLFFKKDQFGNKVYKAIPHAAYRRSIGREVHFAEAAE